MVGIEISGVSFAYTDGQVLHDINLTIRAGEMVGLLGPNGSGKTTLIKLASGILRPGQGEISIDGADLGRLKRKMVARSVAVMPQQFHIPFAFNVGEVVMLGRIPFIRALAGETAVDRKAVDRALEIVGSATLEHRRFDELSGGERQKVILAMVLAQQPQLLLLDEPTVHLDITHQVEILELVRKLNREQGITVVAAMHDLNMASLYFNRLVLLKEGSIAVDGTPMEVITEGVLRRVYGLTARVEPHPESGAPQVIVMPSTSGDCGRSGVV
jgi:iron complex transport system ATP-binding protein